MTNKDRKNLAYDEQDRKPITYRQLLATLAEMSDAELDQSIRIVPQYGRELVGLYTLGTESQQIDITEQIAGQPRRQFVIVARQAV